MKEFFSAISDKAIDFVMTVLITVGIVAAPALAPELPPEESVDFTAGEEVPLEESAVPIVEENLVEEVVDTEEGVDTEEVVADVGVDTEENKGPQIIFSHAEMAYDPKDLEALVDYNSNIFLGKIVSKIKNRGINENYTWPTFEVEVLKNLRGELRRQVILVQTEMTYRDGRIYVTDGGISWPSNVKEEDILLNVGDVHVFATNYSETRDLYGIGIPPYDRELITTDGTLSDTAIVSRARENERVQEFVEAARELGVLNEEWEN